MELSDLLRYIISGAYAPPSENAEHIFRVRGLADKYQVLWLLSLNPILQTGEKLHWGLSGHCVSGLWSLAFLVYAGFGVGLRGLRGHCVSGL